MPATDFLAYQRLALSKIAANPALMGQHGLKQAALGMDAGAYSATAAQQRQQLMYF